MGGAMRKVRIIVNPLLSFYGKIISINSDKTMNIDLGDRIIVDVPVSKIDKNSTMNRNS